MSDADVIASKGGEIRLADGSTATVKFTFANLQLIERRYGSLGSFSDRVQALTPDPDETPEQQAARPVFGPLLEVLACIMPAGPLRDPDQLAEQLTPRYLGDYMAALQVAMAEGFPKADEVPAPDGPGNAPVLDQKMLGEAQAAWAPQTQQTPPPDSFPGDGSGTPPPSSSAAPTPSSGG